MSTATASTTFARAVAALPAAYVAGAYLVACVAVTRTRLGRAASAGLASALGSAVPWRELLLVYNLSIVALSGVTACRMAGFLWRERATVSLFAVEAPDARHQTTFFACLALYRVAKYVELLDTLFFVLRGSLRQVTVLHVFHHSSILVLAEFAARLTPWPSIGVVVALNSFVHVFTYFYYAWSAVARVPVWAKRRVTELQLAQFAVLLTHAALGRAAGTFCIWSLLYGASMIGLFGHFYIGAYLFPARKEKKTESGPQRKQD
jgi:hypothetical protein